MLFYISGYESVQALFVAALVILILVPFVMRKVSRNKIEDRDYELRKYEAEHRRWMEKKEVEDLKSGKLIEQKKGK